MKLDIACGQNKMTGWTGIDIAPLPGVNVVHDLGDYPWPIRDATVDEAFCSHYFEHVPALDRPAFMNEVHRILKPGAGISLVTPLNLARQFQDFTHAWPPVIPQTYAYFDSTWRQSKGISHYAELYRITCDFRLVALEILKDQERIPVGGDDWLGAFARHAFDDCSDLLAVLLKPPAADL